MASITWATVTAFAPALATVATDAQNAILAWANTAIDVSAFDGESGPTTLLARVYLAAHAGTIGKQGAAGAAGPVTMEMVGRVQRTYATPSGGLAFDSLDSTAYGKMYRMLCRTSLATGPWLLDGT